MAHIGMPLIGDPVYGGRPRLPKSPGPDVRHALQQFPRQALHAKALSFTHPVAGNELAFDSPLPDDFEQLLAALRQDREMQPP
jgi:23S rRNA pseudouridine1911/1915/1917 synthase